MPPLLRWVRFNVVGVAGAVVQLCALWFLAHALHFPNVIATMAAVEIAVLHNFVWHEVWTWKGLPLEGRWRRLFRFHLANGLLSVASNTLLTWLFQQTLGWPLLVSNLAAILITAILNFTLANAWVFRKSRNIGALLIAILLLPTIAFCAVFTTKLQPAAIAAWDSYIDRTEKGMASRPLLDPVTRAPILADLNPDGDVPGGYIHHWTGAILIPNATVANVQAVLEDYAHYSQIYAPDVKISSGVPIPESNRGKLYDVRLILDQNQGIGLHFAFDVHSHVTFRSNGSDTLIESRSYSIRESDSAHAPYADLLPEGNDHGVLWRLNSYWRLRQSGSSVYAECQVISLSRKPLFGTLGRVKNLARDSLRGTLQKTRNRTAQN